MAKLSKRKSVGRLKFGDFVRHHRAVSEGTAVDGNIVRSTMMTTDGTETTAELEQIFEGFIHDIIDMCGVERRVMAIAVAVE